MNEPKAPDPHPDPYAGRWVARIKGQVVGQGGTPQQALQAAKAARPKEKAEISFVPAETSLSLPPLLERLRALLPEGQPLYLVGGAVRDLLLGRPIQDFDFTLPGDAISFARRLAGQLSAAFYPMDAVHDVGRILLEEGDQRITLDFIRQRGPDLEADLRARDFTINALALDLRQPQALLDPLGGGADLHARRLRACAPTALRDDPLRVWRGIRMAASFQLKIEPETRAWMKAAASELGTVSPERLRDELFRLLMAPKPATSLRALDMLGALAPVLPELVAVKGIEQPGNHRYTVFEHILRTVESLGVALGALGEDYPEEGAGDLNTGLIVLKLGRYRGQLSQRLRRELVPGRPLGALLTLAAAYHDVGKLPDRVEGGEGKLRFLGHSRLGAELMQARAETLKLSNDEKTILVDLVRHHMAPALLLLEGQITPREVHRYFRQTGEAGVELCLLCIADVMGKFGPELPRPNLEARLSVARTLLDAYYEHYDEVVAPPPLLSGDDLTHQLGLEPGPRIGELLVALSEAQAAGEISNKKEALAFAKALLNP